MNNIKVTISRTDDFFGISTYSREHGRHGRFLVSSARLIYLITDPGHSIRYRSKHHLHHR